MKLVQVAEQNKKYYTKDFIHGFNTGAKTQYEEDKKETERRGRWTDHSDEFDGGYYECSVCGEAFSFIEGTPKENNYRYCPSCGARMEVE